jgi:hypothetical protein
MYMAGSHPLMQDTPLVFTGNAISDWGDNLSKPEDKQDSNNYYNLTSGVANVTKRVVPPLAFGSLYGDYTDTEDREAKTLSEKMLKMLPWRRSELPVRMSKLNPDETVPKPTLLPRVGGVNVDKLLPFGAKPDLAAMDKARATIAETQILPRKLEPMQYTSLQDMAKDAYACASICSYLQGFDLLEAASEDHKWNLDLAQVARIWRGGCIIRSGLLPLFQEFFADKDARHSP